MRIRLTIEEEDFEKLNEVQLTEFIKKLKQELCYIEQKRDGW